MKFRIKAYGDYERGLVDRYATIEADNHDQAIRIAFRKFPEYEEVGAFECDPNEEED